MVIDYNDMLFSFSEAVDIIDREVTGSTTNHGKRVAYMTYKMGWAMHMDGKNLLDILACAVMHDSALSEYISEESDRGNKLLDSDGKLSMDMMDLGVHCRMGEKNIRLLPLETNVDGAVLYHHENADGSGPLGKKAAETPLIAQLIHIADNIDTMYGLGSIDLVKFAKTVGWIGKNRDVMYSAASCDAFLEVMTFDTMSMMSDDRIDDSLHALVPAVRRDYSNDELHNIARLFAEIVDYKSSFTRNHCIGIAEKAEVLGKYYGYDDDVASKLYLTGALHDIGKMIIDSDILEKPDKLTHEEFDSMKNHAWYTYEMMRKVGGFEEITPWAALHHEKLDGSGYPFGKTAKDLDRNSRIMCCLDIYQALTEARPYKKPYCHEDAMIIMMGLAVDGLLDRTIVNDIDSVFAD
ncbi:MAG: HD domain-containing protein [Eubacteriaceae bacterium]|jgi:HD-GYP domain-containing protein (c-di-GMP phosphodiesterase class II)|nr:HD domain-containing protein [Eubacteriaceae bacterium]